MCTYTYTNLRVRVYCVRKYTRLLFKMTLRQLNVFYIVLLLLLYPSDIDVLHLRRDSIELRNIKKTIFKNTDEHGRLSGRFN